MYMPWGKYRGRHVRAVPLSYLCWVLEECDNVSPYLDGCIRQELADRLGLEARPGLDVRRVSEALAGWHRRACLRHHPDRGGSQEVMAALNDARDELAKLIEAC